MNKGSQLTESQQLLLRLFNKSVLKKAKYAAISRYLPELDGLICLDIGADNGVISFLLRQMGGKWHSADLDELVVESIRNMVGDSVHQIDGGATEFPENYFDLVVIIDFLEHIHEDQRFVEELTRVIKPGGQLIINVPHHKPGSIIRKLRLMLDLTDEKHGHVRPGYTLETLGSLLEGRLEITESHTYSKFFVELFDIAISLYFDRVKKGHTSSKGNVVTADDLRKQKKQFKLFSIIYPVVALLQALDRLLFFSQGHSLIVHSAVIDK